MYEIGHNSRNNNYQIIKKNVDNLKIIQIGLTLSDKDGNLPNGISTWQFNFKFDVKKDQSSTESINLLENAGINFPEFLQRGICPSNFAESLISSGLVLNENVNWLTFHGIYDLAYLLNLLTNQNLPDNEELFYSDLNLYFHNFYDIRHIIKEINWLRGSLSKLSSYFDIQRVGSAHQAGSDSLVTSKLYFKIIEQFSDNIDLKSVKNSVSGIDEERISNPLSLNESHNLKMNNNKICNVLNNQNKQNLVEQNQTTIRSCYKQTFNNHLNLNSMNYHTNINFKLSQNIYNNPDSTNTVDKSKDNNETMSRFNKDNLKNFQNDEINCFSGSLVIN